MVHHGADRGIQRRAGPVVGPLRMPTQAADLRGNPERSLPTVSATVSMNMLFSAARSFLSLVKSSVANDRLAASDSSRASRAARLADDRPSPRPSTTCPRTLSGCLGTAFSMAAAAPSITDRVSATDPQPLKWNSLAMSPTRREIRA